MALYIGNKKFNGIITPSSIGPAGADGKSAYQYAVEGGYTGTEEEFAAKLAEENIPNPSTASVGQTIVVKSVDESGKPTEWEAADYLAAHPIQESDPTVPDWAKQPDKPSYTAAEIGAQPDMNVSSFNYIMEGLGEKNVVYVSYGGSTSPIPSGRYPVLFMRSGIDRGQASIVAYDATGKTWKGNVNFTQGILELVEQSSSDPFIVTQTDETHASHSATEIYEAIQSGKIVQFCDSYNYLYQLCSYGEDWVVFSCISTYTDPIYGGITYTDTIVIDNDKNIISQTNKEWNTLFPRLAEAVILHSSTEGSNKGFWIAVDDSGTIKTFNIDDSTEVQFAKTSDIPTVDSTLTQSGQAADAAAVGGRLSNLSEEIANLQTSGLTTAQVNALDGLFKIVAYTADPASAYSAFKVAFGLDGGGTGVTLSSISATYSGGDVAVGTALSALTGIVVTATYSDGSTATVTGYTLSGEIAEGSNTITVTYQGKTATFIVTGTAVAQTYTVTNNLTNVTNSNSATTASGYYSATLSAEEGYNINVTITMGGVDITGSVYGDGHILISEVTGNIVITAVAGKTILYRLADTPKSVDGLSEDTGIVFGSSDANGYVKAMTICIAYTGFDLNETLMKMSSGAALRIETNGAGGNGNIRVTACSNAVHVAPSLSDAQDYRVVITKDAKSGKTINIHTLSSGLVATVSNVGTYGNFSHSACAGNLLVGSSDITVNNFTIYEGVLSSADIAAFLSGGDI